MTAVLFAPHKCVIYGLTDESGNVRYVGRTTKPLEHRRARHIWQARQSGGSCNRYVSRWIRSAGYRIGIIALETDPADSREAERVWVARLTAEGARLTNLTRGGEGAPPRGFLLSPEQRAKISEANRRRWANPAARERLAESNRAQRTGFGGRHHSEETKRKLSAAQKGIPKGPPSDETRRRMSEAAKRRALREGRGVV